MTLISTPYQPSVRRAWLLPGILLGLAMVSLAAQAASIVPDTWYSAQTENTSVEGGGTRFITNQPVTGSFQSILTYFESVNLSGVGDSLSVTLSFSGVLGINRPDSEYPFGFAFYNSGGSQISANGQGQNGSRGSDRPYNAYRGYRVDMNTAARRNQSPMRLVGRATDNSALAFSGAHTVSFGGGKSTGAKALESDTLYSVSYTITRTDVNTLGVTFSITGGSLSSGSYNGSWSVASTSESFTSAFDTFAITLSGVKTFDSLTLYDVSITAPGLKR